MISWHGFFCLLEIQKLKKKVLRRQGSKSQWCLAIIYNIYILLGMEIQLVEIAYKSWNRTTSYVLVWFGFTAKKLFSLCKEIKYTMTESGITKGRPSLS